MEDRIQSRITELEQGERDTMLQLTVIRNLLIELRALLTPDPVVTGAPLGVALNAHDEERAAP